MHQSFTVKHIGSCNCKYVTADEFKICAFALNASVAIEKIKMSKTAENDTFREKTDTNDTCQIIKP